MNSVFNYNQESAVKAGSSDYVEVGGAYACTIKSAEYVTATSGAKSFKFSIETSEGLKCGHINVYYQKKDGTENTYGTAIINAIMGLLKLKALTSRAAGTQYLCPELEGKQIGLFLQKVIYARTDGSEGFKFEIAIPFSVARGQTLREILDNKNEVEELKKRTSHYKDKREVNNQPSRAIPYGNEPPAHTDYDIPY